MGDSKDKRRAPAHKTVKQGITLNTKEPNIIVSFYSARQIMFR